jgi:hypothetical protein
MWLVLCEAKSLLHLQLGCPVTIFKRCVKNHRQARSKRVSDKVSSTGTFSGVACRQDERNECKIWKLKRL